MTPAVSVIVPVKDGSRYLGEVLAAAAAQGADELLVIDSGSTDGSVAIAEAAGARVLTIPPETFSHGRTRNLGAEETTGDLMCFLTQDATPEPGWLDACREAFALADGVGAAFGPQRPRADTPPMIARELAEFFTGFSPAGEPVVHGRGDVTYLSNVNACYARACWEAIRFDDVPYSEDQRFGAALLAAGWLKVYHPGAAVLHAHDFGPVRFARRYFDEYRGLRNTTGHVEGFAVRSALGIVRNEVAADRRWMRRQGWASRRQVAWTARSVVHHGERRVFSALGSSAYRLPAPVQRAISLEGRAERAPEAETLAGAPAGREVIATWQGHIFDEILAVARDGPAPLRPVGPGSHRRERLHIAVVIPPFRRGSGGHSTIFGVMARLERRGHTVSIWLFDPIGLKRDEWPAVVRRQVREYFGPVEAPVHKGFDDWFGADVALATGWETVYPVLTLPHTGARAYFVQDHEPEFFPTSAQSHWAERTYSQGLHCIAASPWLGDLLERRYGASATVFDLGVDHEVYHPRPVTRREDTVVFYARDATPRRAVPLGMLALEELRRRRPEVRLVLYGDPAPNNMPFGYRHLGIASPEELSWAYSEATVGVCLSMTNYSLIPQEMLACGLPCVDLAGFSAETVFGRDGPVTLTEPDPVALANAIERLLDDRRLHEQRAAAGLDFVADRTWERASDQIEAGLREALRRREPASS